VALADPAADIQALRLTCEEALQLSTQQEHLIDALLTLASSERGVERWQPVDLARLTADAVEHCRPEADRHGLRIDARCDAAMTGGDPDLVASLITNLLQNAIRHNVTGGSVEISTATTPDDGHGLGLAIVQAIARTHGATLAVHCRTGGGLEVEVTFRAA
jgi:signal transduction histidine kinase